MATHQVDTEDAVVYPLFVLAAAAMVEIADVTLFSYAFTDTVTTLAGSDISIATVVAAVAFGVVVFTNEVNADDVRDLPDEYMWAVIATIAMILAVAFIPELSDYIIGNDVLAVGAVGVMTAGVIAVGWMA